MPLALYCAFSHNMGVKGLWFGFSIACIVLDLGFWAIIACCDWKSIADNMKLKIALDGTKDPNTTPDGVSIRRKFSTHEDDDVALNN